MIVELQCLASPAGTPDDPYRHIDAAIAVVQGSGLKYEVGALGTTVEGEPDEVWPLHAAGARGLPQCRGGRPRDRDQGRAGVPRRRSDPSTA